MCCFYRSDSDLQRGMAKRSGSERGEAPRAYVSIKDEAKDHTTEEQLAAWVAHRVARHKWLTGGVMIVDGIPRLASGKIDRKIIRGWTKGESTQDTRSKL